MDEVCRICLSNKNLSNIFSQDENVSQNITKFASVQVQPNDGLPQYICSGCKNNLEMCLNFVTLCQSTDDMYRKMLTKSKLDEIVNFDLLGDRYSAQRRAEGDEDFICANYDRVFGANGREPQCEACDKYFPSRRLLLKHLRETHTKQQEKSVQQCHVCGKILKYRAELERHLCSHSGVKHFKCDICEKTYISKSALTKHLIKHSGVRKYDCLLCPKSFLHPSNLQIHSKVHANLRNYACGICAKSFKANRTLQLHLKIHSNERHFPCTECDKAFVNKYDLSRHAKLHEKKRLIQKGVYDGTKEEDDRRRNMRQCELCGKICYGAGDLKKHLRVHSNERPYGCSECGKSFKSSSTLHGHERIHSLLRAYACRFCGRAFVQSSNLKTHERLHSGVRPHVCNFCGRPFNRKRDLDNHYKRHSTNVEVKSSATKECAAMV